MKDKYLIVYLLGMISGFTLMISSNTLNYWLSVEGISVGTIGIFAIISLPYAINFIWAPILDTRSLGRLSSRLGQRVSWVLVVQLLLALFIIILSFIPPNNNLFLFGFFSFIIALLSSTQDSLLGALRTEVIAKEDHGATSGTYIFGYRAGMLLSSSGAIYLSSYISWSSIYITFAITILAFSILIMLSGPMIQRNKLINSRNEKVIHKSFIAKILKPVGSYSFVITVVMFLILYRLPDNFIAQMINPFLLHLGYGAQEIASVGKFFGLLSAIIGGFLGSFVMRHWPVTKCLLVFGLLHAIAHSLFILQEIYGKNLELLCLVIGFESVTGGMAMAAYITFITNLCSGKFRATQYAFFSSMMGLSRSIFPMISGYIVIKFGWQNFFWFVTIATIPAFYCLIKLSSSLKNNGGKV